MTYKSFRELCRTHVASRRLFTLEFRLPGPAMERTLLLSPEVASLVFGPWPESPAGERCASLRATLEGFIAGNAISVCWPPFVGRSYHQVGRLSPVELGVWDIRSVEPKPGLRVMFCLGERDVAVALVCSPRSVVVDWLDRSPLGPRHSRAWRDIIRETREFWDELFPTHRPLIGETLDECISNATAV